MLESLEKLRKWAQKFGPMGSHDPLMLADEIQAEIDANYMELPLDADGVPIRLGDLLVTSYSGEFKVLGIGTNSWNKICAFGGKHNMKCPVEECRHVKPRTLEDVLIDAMQFGFSSHAGDDVSEKAREFANEIRELFGGDAE